jgi:hypothetical protein
MARLRTSYHRKSLDVHPVRALDPGVPDGFPGLHPARLHLVRLGDDARALVPEHPDRDADQVLVADPLGAAVEAVGVEMSDERHGGTSGGASHPLLYSATASV